MKHKDFKRHWKRQKWKLIEAMYAVRIRHLQSASRYSLDNLAKMTGSHRNTIWLSVNGMYTDSYLTDRADSRITA